MTRVHIIEPIEKPGHIPYCNYCNKEITVVYFRENDGKRIVFWAHGAPGSAKVSGRYH